MKINTIELPKSDKRDHTKILTNNQRNLILSMTIKVANDNKADKSDRIVSCLIGLMLTMGLRLAETTSLLVNSLELKFCEETNRIGYFLKYTTANGTREQYCSDTSAMFFNVAKEIHDSDKRLVLDRHLFIVYNNRSQKPMWISISLFEHYYHRFYIKYLQELTEYNGELVMPTSLQYRQTYLRAQLEFQQKQYRTGELLPESELDDFEKLVFK